MTDAWAPPAEIQMNLPGAGSPAPVFLKALRGAFSEEPGGTENSQLHMGCV